uniref:Tetraspanin n=1 Tax=Gopherus evgoodei TaxID=1825980 RepID=A0A8C4Y5A0_9SAUR
MGCFSFLKLMMFVFNGVIFLSGLAVLGIGIWVKVDGGSFVQILGAAAPQLMQLINVGYLCIAVGTFLLLMGFLGCCGAMKESKCMLLLFFVIILILFIAEVAGAVVVLAFSSVLKCCGFNNYKDFNSSYFYQTHSQTYPMGCCLPPKHECLESELDSICHRSGAMALTYIVGGVALGIGVLEVRLTLLWHTHGLGLTRTGSATALLGNLWQVTRPTTTHPCSVPCFPHL